MPHIPTILANYPTNFQPNAVETLAGAGGFSGAALWRIASPAGPLCLRCWPREMPTERLQYIHAVLDRVGRAALPFVPVPCQTRDGRTFVQYQGRQYELTPWLPGVADFHQRPSDGKLTAAVESLARFHLAACFEPPVERPSPGLALRLESLIRWQSDLRRLQAAVATAAGAIHDRATELIRLYPLVAGDVERHLRTVAGQSLPIQPCIRDIWHDHVLYTDEQVTGIVDYGAMRADSVAGDLARLLGSLIGDDLAKWQSALDRYQAVRPLSPDEQRAIVAFDRANVLLSGMNWLRWIFLEDRQFDSLPRVVERLDEHLRRLRIAAA